MSRLNNWTIAKNQECVETSRNVTSKHIVITVFTINSRKTIHTSTRVAVYIVNTYSRILTRIG